MFDTVFAKFAILVLSFIDALLVSLGIATSSRAALAPGWQTIA